VDYTEYTGKGCSVKEYALAMSDGVRLKMIDFTPKSVHPGKPIVLFIAGWISLIQGWKGVLKVLTPRFRVLYLETREKTSSVLPAGGRVSFTMERMARDIHEVVEQAIPGNKSFIIAGSSLGATAIVEQQLMEGRKPLCTVLIAPVAEFRYPAVLGSIIPALPPSLYLAIKPIVKWYLRNFRLDAKKEPEQMQKYSNTLDAADPYKLKPNAIAIRNYAVWDKLPGVRTPTLIVGATTDTLHGTNYLTRMTELLPRAAYRELESNKETHSEKAGELIAGFLDRKEYLEI
jgi:pimeloyl-ACP methyl ester carboxylesterase